MPALEHYSKSRKIFMTGLVVLLAATFTVTGAMIAGIGSQGGAPIMAGEISGEEIPYADFRMTRRALGSISFLDATQSPFNVEGERIYARVPVMNPRPDGVAFSNSMLYSSDTPSDASLLEIWPQYQDQHVWCHYALYERAKESGVDVPSNERIGALVFERMNERRPDTDKFSRSNLFKEFRDSFGAKFEEYLPTFRQALMIREYVDSLLSVERANLDAIADIAGGNNEEIKARWLRLKVDRFMDEAAKDVARDHFNARARAAATNTGMASIASGSNRFEEAFDKNRNQHLYQQASFSFDVIEAYPERLISGGDVEIEEERAKLIYLALRDELYQATEADKSNLDSRLKTWENREAGDPDKADWTEAQWKKAREEMRPQLEKYKSFDEVRAELYQSLERENALLQAQTNISMLRAKLEEIRTRRARELDAELAAERKRQDIPQQKRDYLRTLRSQFDSIRDNTWARLNGIGNGIKNPAETNVDELNRMADSIARELSSIDTNQLEGLTSTARQTAQNLERSARDKRAELEEFLADEDRENAAGETMSPEERSAKQKELEYALQALEEKIALRDSKIKLVDDFATGLRAMLAGYILRVRSTKDGDKILAHRLLKNLVQDIPAELGKACETARDAIVPEEDVEALEDSVQLIKADVDAMTKNKAKTASDTRGLDLRAMCVELDLNLRASSGTMDWAGVLKDPDFSWLENVDGAKAFLESPDNTEGSISNIMGNPGKGYILLRLRDKKPRHPQGRIDASDRVNKLAKLRRARELAVQELKRIRREIIDLGWDKAVNNAKSRNGASFQTGETDYFTAGVDLPGIYSESDTDVAGVSGGPSAQSPDGPFVNAVRDMDAADGVSTIIPEKRNQDPEKRPDYAEWSYMLAQPSGRRLVERRLKADDLNESGFNAPASMWRKRRLVSSDLVYELITPARLLEGKEVIFYPERQAEEDSDNSEE